MSFGLVTGLLFAAISIYMASVECSIKTAEAETPLVSASEEFMSGPVRSQKLTGFRNRRQLSTLFIYPGTKWCGVGKKAAHEGDYGTNVQTDKCCQEHDGCDTYIAAYGYKYGLRNSAHYTVSGCDCDEKFLNCMVGVEKSSTAHADDKKAANDFGKLFFNTISPRCLKEDYPFVCVESGWIGNCKEYKQDTTKDKVWQLVSGPDFP